MRQQQWWCAQAPALAKLNRYFRQGVSALSKGVDTLFSPPLLIAAKTVDFPSNFAVSFTLAHIKNRLKST